MLIEVSVRKDLSPAPPVVGAVAAADRSLFWRRCLGADPATEGVLQPRQRCQAFPGGGGTALALAGAHAILEQPVRELLQVCEVEVVCQIETALLLEFSQEVGLRASVDALERPSAIDVGRRPDMGVLLLRHFLLDGELESFFDENAVEVIEVRLVLRRADQGLKLLIADLERRVTMEDQRLSLLSGDGSAYLFKQPFGQEEPVECLTANQVPIVAVRKGLLRLVPARHRLEQGDVP